MYVVSSFVFSFGYVELWLLLVWSRWPMLDVWILGLYLLCCEYCIVLEIPFLDFCYKCRYNRDKYLCMYVLDQVFMFFNCLVVSNWRFCLLARMLCSGSHHNPVWWSLHNFRMLQPFLIMLTDYFQRLHWILHHTSLLLIWVRRATVMVLIGIILFHMTDVVVTVWILLLMLVCWHIMVKHKWCVRACGNLCMLHMAWCML